MHSNLSNSWLSCWFGSKLWENKTTRDKSFSNTQPSKIFSTEVQSNTVEFSRHTFTKLESLAYIWWTCVLIFSPLWSPLGFNSELSIAIRSQQSPSAQWQLIIFGFSESDQMHLFQASVESEGLQGALHRNEQIIIISLLVGGGYPQSIQVSIIYIYSKN